MTDPNILAPLNNIYEMQAQILQSVPETDAARQYHPELASLKWLYGYSVYQELYWLREILMGDADLTKRIEELFGPGDLDLQARCERMPPRDHLLNWAREIRDEHLMRIANPNMLPEHPLLEQNRLLWFLLQEQAKHYETMLLVLNQRQLLDPAHTYRVKFPLTAAAPGWETKELTQGHYRIGSRHQPAAYDNELPPQAVELSSFRIALKPVSNAQYLSFMETGGYTDASHWSEAGWQWQQTAQCRHPAYWHQDDGQNWYLIGINGSSDLPAEEPVSGINHYEAQAYANWVDALGGEFAGAVLQHEYQWEIAARSGVFTQMGRAWEWCSNLFHPYPSFTPFPAESVSMDNFNTVNISLRGASLHTQRVLRRISMRHWSPPRQRFQLTGLRLVFPPRHAWNG
jgi:iron(II)-dependent oxidoreductase